MARLNATWNNFSNRGQSWDFFWQDAVSTYPALCIDENGNMVFKLTATPSDYKLYLNAGEIYRRLFPVSGDKILTVDNGQLIAT